MSEREIKAHDPETTVKVGWDKHGEHYYATVEKRGETMRFGDVFEPIKSTQELAEKVAPYGKVNGVESAFLEADRVRESKELAKEQEHQRDFASRIPVR